MSARLDQDDPDGAGPENITMEQVESEAIYRVATTVEADSGPKVARPKGRDWFVRAGRLQGQALQGSIQGFEKSRRGRQP